MQALSRLVAGRRRNAMQTGYVQYNDMYCDAMQVLQQRVHGSDEAGGGAACMSKQVESSEGLEELQQYGVSAPAVR